MPIRGLELSTFFGHANLLGAAGWVDWHAPHALAIRRIQHDVRAAGALLVVNHPCALGNPHCTGCRWDFSGTDYRRVACLEVWNGLWGDWETRNPEALAMWTDLLNEGYRVTAVAGTDSHSASRLSLPGMPFTWVHTRGLGEQAVMTALRRGRAIISSGPRVDLRTEQGGAVLPGATQPAQHAVSVDVAGIDHPATLWMVADGEVVDSHPLESPGGWGTFQLARRAAWSRWELRAGSAPNGELLALTNPVYQKAS
ncbi:MAG: CehA/McbA family metallohydrolase [Acidimicrobiia bacterium]